MTHQRLAVPESPIEELVVTGSDEVQVIFGAIGRFGISHMKGPEAAERSIRVALKLKGVMESSKQGAPIVCLFFVEDEMTYILDSLERAANEDPRENRRLAAQNILLSMQYVEVQPATLPTVLEVAALEQFSLTLAS